MKFVLLFLTLVLCVCMTSCTYEPVISLANINAHLRNYSVFFADNDRIFVALGFDALVAGNKFFADASVFVLDTVDQLALAYAYFVAAGQIPSQGSSGDAYLRAAAFAVYFRALDIIEYVNTDDTPGFHPGVDTIVGYYNLSNENLTWNPLYVNHTVLVDRKGNKFDLWILTAETKDQVFRIRVIYCGIAVNVDGFIVTPDQAKVVIEIKWFDNPLFTGPSYWSSGPTATPGSQVGLVSFVAAAAGKLSAQASDSSGSGSSATGSVTFTGTYGGLWSWSSNCNVQVSGVGEAGTAHSFFAGSYNGVEVTAYVDVGWVATFVFFSFEGTSPRPEYILWDPTVGGDINYGSSGSGLVVPNCVALLLALLLLLFVTVRR